MERADRTSRLSDIARVKFISGRSEDDAVNYARECDKQGIDPEDRELYEQGRGIIEMQAELRTESISDNRGEKYCAFLKDVNSEGVRTDNLAFGIDFKRDLLVKYFPGRFGVDGKQPLKDVSSVKVGKIFKRVVEYSKKQGKKN